MKFSKELAIFGIIELLLMAFLIAPTEATYDSTHSYKIGTPGVNEVTINWTDDKNYTKIDKSVSDITASQGYETWLETIFHLSAQTANDTEYNDTLSFDIFWHPEKKRSPNQLVPEIKLDPGDIRSDITIQGEKNI